jgi:serine/threonine protein kinase
MTDGTADDDPFAELLDDVLQQLLDGRQPDAAAVKARHPQVADRFDEAVSLATDVAGRRTTVRPVLPGYEILRELGRGGMGTVYLAQQRELDRTVALKVLPQTLGLAERQRQRFLSEARALARVEHENVVRIHRIVDDGELLAFEMEFVDGPSLQQLLDHLRQHRARTGTPAGLAQVGELLQLPVDRLGTRSLTQFFVHLALSLGRALGVMHGKGLVHRDVKPANVLLRRDGTPVLVDFGLVRGMPHDPSRTVGFVGTPVYSSPEQLRGDAPVGPATDVYALAVTLYECVALTTPFAGRTTGEVLRRIESGTFPPLRRSAPGVPRDLETIVAHAMESVPENRYADGNALADDLQRLLELQPIRARPAGPVRRLGKLVRRHYGPLLAAGAGALLVVAAMWPWLDDAHAATRRARAHDHVRQAQLSLLSRDAQRRSWQGAVRGGLRSPSSSPVADEPLQRAEQQYDQALALAPDDSTTRGERDVVRLARWLQKLSIPDPAALPRELASPEFGKLCAGLGPVTIDAARRFAAGTESAGTPTADFRNAAPQDVANVGLLAFLLGEFRICENAWGSLPPAQLQRPLVEAGLGLIELGDGRPELAYVRLLAAHRGFADAADTLAVELADAALALGDLALVRHWLDSVAANGPHAALRERMLLDLRLARGDDDGLAGEYTRLAREDPGDPLPRRRLAQLALRRGDLDDASRRFERLVAEWPRDTGFRLDFARVALQRRDIRAYLAQVLAVVEQDYGRGRSGGAVADLLEILRIGGLHELHRAGIVATGGERGGRVQFGGEMPVRELVRPALATVVEQLVPYVAGARRRAASFADKRHPLPPGIETAFVTTPLLLAQLPSLPCTLPQRAALAATPWVTTWVAPWCLRFARGLTWTWFNAGWHHVALTPIPRPPEAAPEGMFGNALADAGDCTGDGVSDVLVACGVLRHSEGHGSVALVDGATMATLSTLHGDSERHLFGYSLAVVGDVDRDGADDWLIGAPSGNPEALHGHAELWSGRERKRIAVVEGPGPGFGVSVAALDDADGDGTRDFAVATAPLLRNAAAQGSVQVVSGRTRAILRTYTSDVPGIWFGASIAAAGDTDGDGCVDLLVGGNFGNAPGVVHLYSGKTGAILHTWTEPDPSAGFGTLVLGVGDVNGDRRGDVLITSLRSGDRSGVDHVSVFSGATAKRLARLEGSAPGARFGTSVAVYRTSQRPLLVISAPFGGAAMSGSIEFWLPSGAKVSTVLGPSALSSFGASLAVLADRDGDGLPEVLLGPGPGKGGVWLLPSRQIRFGE